MPVDSTHCQYDEASPKWQRMRAVLAGEDKVKELGESFLPKLNDQDPKEYTAYKTRAQFFNATTRTRDAFSGMIFRKAPDLKTPAAIEAFLKDCDMAGQPFAAFLKHVTDEVIGVGRIGTLIDWNPNEARPYLASYLPEQILNWRIDRINGRAVLALLVLKEQVDADSTISGQDQTSATVKAKAPAQPDHGAVTGPGPTPEEQAGKKKKRGKQKYDEFNPERVDQIRVYRLASSGQTDTQVDGEKTTIVQLRQVVCEVYRKDEDKKEYELIQSITPLRKGKPLSEIPFVFHGPRDASPECERPPLEDIAQVNLSHYRSSADLEHGRHFTGLPTPWVAGFPEKTELKIGSATAWVSTDPQATAGFLEFTGQGLSALKEALEQKEMQMAVLGARMLEAPKKAVETAEAMTIRASGEASVLTNIARSLSQSFAQVLKWAFWWYGAADKKLADIADSELSVSLNTDFAALKLDGQTIVALVKAYQSAVLSRDSVLYVLKQGELVSPDRTPEEEAALIETEKLPPRALPPGNGNPVPAV